MIRRVTAAALGGAVALALVASACGGSSEGSDKPAEKPAGSSADGSVDLDTEGGTVKYDDGKGNQTNMNIDGSGAPLPDGWPAALAPPDSVTVQTSTTSDDGSMTIIGDTDAATDAVSTALKAQVGQAGFDIGQETSSDVTGDGYAGFSAAKGDQQLVVSISKLTAGSAKTTVSMTLKDAS